MHRLTALFIISILSLIAFVFIAGATSASSDIHGTPQLYRRSGWSTPNGRHHDGRCRKSLWDDILRWRWRRVMVRAPSSGSSIRVPTGY